MQKSFGESTGVVAGQQTSLVRRLKKLKKILEDANLKDDEKVKQSLKELNEEKRV